MKLKNLLSEYGWRNNFVQKPKQSGLYKVVTIFGEKKFMPYSTRWHAWNVLDSDENNRLRVPNCMIRYWKEH